MFVFRFVLGLQTNALPILRFDLGWLSLELVKFFDGILSLFCYSDRLDVGIQTRKSGRGTTLNPNP